MTKAPTPTEMSKGQKTTQTIQITQFIIIIKNHLD